MSDPAQPRDLSELSGAVEAVEGFLLGEPPSLNQFQVAEQAGVSIEVAEELWRLLGFAHVPNDEIAFTPGDVQALIYSQDLMKLGVLSPDRRGALVRTWGRSYARLAEWQTALLTDVARESGTDPVEQVAILAEQVLPRVEALQNYVWRRHLASASSRMLAVEGVGSPASHLAVCFVDIVGYTSHSKTLDEAELVAWIEYFEDECARLVIDHGGRIIKNLGDEVLFVVEDPIAAAEIALLMTERGADLDDRFPLVRAGLSYGEVVSRLGDVFGPTVNIASRVTTLARPGAVLVDRGAYEVLSGIVFDGSDPHDPAIDRESDPGISGYRFRRMRRTSVKGYSRLQSWVLRRPKDAD